MKNFEEFYPTPEVLLEKITEGCDWKRIHSVLEPEAGKGDIVSFLQKKAEENYMREYDIDCIESEQELQMILKGKNMRVVFDDFLKFHSYKRYDLILMNPPFSNGDAHLLKALEMQKRGGNIICILNAETVRNPYTNRRKELVQKLQDVHADIQFMEHAFQDAERPTGVEIAVIKVSIPKEENTSHIFEDLKRAKIEMAQRLENVTDLAENDYIKATVQRYEIETEACLAFIREYQGLRPYIMENLKNTGYDSPILALKFHDHEFKDGDENKVIRAIRKKYWKALFADSRFTGKMTSQQRNEYMSQVERLADYDFNMYNIKTLQLEMTKNLVTGIETCIMELFDELSHEYSWMPETGRNIHYYNAWTTNKAYIINKKVIIPMHGVFSDIWKEFQYKYEVYEKLSDIEKVFDYLSGVQASKSNTLYEILRNAENDQQSKNIECKYFTVTFYKKGTCHILFHDEELLKKFNIFGSQHKGWLPPSYGKKKYEDMTQEEQEVVNGFEGKAEYEKIMLNPNWYIVDLNASVMKIAENVA